MKKIVLMAAALVVTASAAYAAVGVSGTKHDMSASNGLSGGTGKDQLCIYCHTPHNAQVNIPLWNRLNGAAITRYDSTTLTATAKAASVDGTTISGFCMSCHDGTTSMGAIKNKAGGTDAGVALTALVGYNAKNNIGNSLTNDHPVGFNYASAVSDETDGGLKTLASAQATLTANAFFTTGNVSMECATCHKVHDNSLTPFLRLNNAGSNLCLACHVK